MREKLSLPGREAARSYRRCAHHAIGLLLALLLVGPSVATALAQSSRAGSEPAAPTEGVAPSANENGKDEKDDGKDKDEPEDKAQKKKKKKKKFSYREMKKMEEKLAPQFRDFLDAVHFLISDEERQAFFELEQDYQREAFIERFWRIRDTYKDSARNEFRDHWEERLFYAKSEFGDLREDRTRILLTNGVPTARIPFKCTTVVYPLEIWFYDGSERVGYEFFVLFYARNGGKRYYMWHPTDGVGELVDFGAAASSTQDFFQDIYTCRDGDTVAGVLYRLLHPNNRMNYEMLLSKIERPSVTPDGEWLATFEAYSTDLPEDARTFPAEVAIEYPSRYQSRTVMKGTIQVPKDSLSTVELANQSSFNLYLTGEVLREDKLFEQFRYKYDMPTADVQSEKVPLVFQRRIRPGAYKLVLKLEDLNGKSFFRHEEDVDVPRLEGTARRLPDDPESRKIFEAADLAIMTDVPTIKLVEPYGTMQVGMVRFDTLVTGKDIEEVRFALDGRVVLQKRRPPFSVELDLGSVPRTRTIRVSAHDAEGTELTSDELTLNAGEHQFKTRLIEPRRGLDYTDSVEVEAAVLTPEGRPIERVEIYYNETLKATLYQEPWVQRIDLPEPGKLAYIRAVAYLPDGNSTDDLVYINAPDYLENVDVEFVELYATVLDRQKRPIQGLTAENFTIFEDGVAQEIARFEVVDNLPIYAQVMIDVSASMEGNVEATQRAALQFFQEMITSKDRASLVTFNDHPYLAVKLTNDVDELAGGLAGLKAERGTALYDAVVFGLYYMNGLKGQKAMLLLSDGKDEVSKFTWDQTLEYARRAGVAIYAIGLDIKGKEAGKAKNQLEELSNETGGRAFFIKDISELAVIYDAIQDELRSRYLIAYQSTNSDASSGFREVQLKSAAPGSEAKTMRGYYP